MRRGYWLLLSALLFACAGFASLGVWQLHRLAWKRDLIKTIDARIHAAAVAAPGPALWPSITASGDAYRRVRVEGFYRHDLATHVLAVTVRGGGFWVITPFVADQGFTVLVNRGFVPEVGLEKPDQSQNASHMQVNGLLRMTEPKGGFLRKNDPGAERWYSRDVMAIAEVRHLGQVAPYFIDADDTAGAPRDAPRDAPLRGPVGGPVGGLTVIDLPNNHFAYALTWFAMAVLAIGAVAVAATHTAASDTLMSSSRL